MSMKKLFATTALLLASTGTALAQTDDVPDDTTTTDTSGGIYTENATANTSTESSNTNDTSMSSGTGGAGGKQMAIATELNTTADVPVLHFLYDLGGNYLDIQALLAITNVSPEAGDGTTDFQFGLGVGYRMYKDMDGRIHPYLEPYVNFALAQFGDDTVADETDIGAGANLGVDFMLFDQFTIGAAVGAGLNFNIASDVANTLSIGVYTTSINAAFWWG
jgi:hypothetical protein